MNSKIIAYVSIIGGSTLLGLGIGFLFLPISALYFLASLIIGIGTGVLFAPILAKWWGGKEQSSD